MKKPIKAGIALLIIGFLGLAFALSNDWLIHTNGIVKATDVEVYWFSNRTVPVTTIDWDLLAPGETATRNIWIYNPGNANETLSLSTTAWNPANASSYISLTWDRTGYILGGGETISATLTLTISNSISGITSYQFDIIITGTLT